MDPDESIMRRTTGRMSRTSGPWAIAAGTPRVAVARKVMAARAAEVMGFELRMIRRFLVPRVDIKRAR
jgi:hypothetical protein